MKKVTTLFVLVFCLHLSGQVTNKELKELTQLTHTIVINNTKTKAENYQYVGELLMNLGIGIAKSDKEFWFIDSEPRHLDGLNVLYKFHITLRDSAVWVSGRFRVDDISWPDYDMIENKGMMGSPMRDSFKQMYIFALKVGKKENMKFVWR